MLTVVTPLAVFRVSANFLAHFRSLCEQTGVRILGVEPDKD